MSNILIIHGSHGHPEENWFPWLKLELEELGQNVHVPRFPTPENQSLDNWLAVFKDYEEYLNEEAIVVGHSLGPPFLLTILERRNSPIRAAFFVSGFIGAFTGKWKNPDFDEINKTFTEKQFDWEKITENCKKFYVYQSDDDPYVPMEKARDLAKNLGVEVRILQELGHFNQKEFPILLDDITMELPKAHRL